MLVPRLTPVFPLMLVALLLAPAAARAHGDAGRLEVTAVTVAPGSAITVRGFDLGQTGLVTITLVAPDGHTVEIGTAEPDGQGGFEIRALIPTATAAGPYVVRASLADGDHLDAQLVVEAAGLEPGEHRAQEEPLLAPVPSLDGRPGPAGPESSAQGSTRAVSAAAAADPPTAADPALDPSPAAPATVFVLVIAAAISATLLVRRRGVRRAR